VVCGGPQTLISTVSLICEGGRKQPYAADMRPAMQGTGSRIGEYRVMDAAGLRELDA
jgi:hypothetical protein